MTIFFIKWSRLKSGFHMVRFSDAQDWHKIQSKYRPRFGIRWFTVLINMGGGGGRKLKTKTKTIKNLDPTASSTPCCLPFLPCLWMTTYLVSVRKKITRSGNLAHLSSLGAFKKSLRVSLEQ
jgi:hypothetical protein